MTEDELPGRIVVVDEGGQPVIRLSGEIDSLVVAAYEDGLPGRSARAPSVIDASEVTFLDGRGLRFLVRTTRAAAGPGPPRCCAARPGWCGGSSTSPARRARSPSRSDRSVALRSVELLGS